MIRNNWLTNARKQRANAYSRNTIHPTLIVVHETTGRLDKYSTVRFLAGRSSRVSYHIIIERDGTVTQMVPLNQKAWHAGKSSWSGRKYCNGFSIGIGLVGPGKMDATGRAWFGEAGAVGIVHKATKEHGDGYWLKFTDEQYKALVEICAAIAEEYPDCNELAGHFEVSPGRKIDPHPLLDMEQLRRDVFEPAEPAVEDEDDKPGDPPVVGEKTKTAIGVAGLSAGITTVGTFTGVASQAQALFPKKPSVDSLIWPSAIIGVCLVAAFAIARWR